ncbi:ATP-binding cassette (ABC) antibiotic efflux pump [Caprobacter fermentans]|uniref:ATP-binding cassette (ABC) antibiotic efflux pump n=1 Tax=Caproicibacter fermentans TaxID=2576756 RepID=A0A6N8I3U9_9FIRM|nr:ABC transporter transmembrane domain-containing protein [Caproicibacter fermentans]MVB12270.1 ATP-binding cassette (ABC) antibiotic efflux pump [Caproicibacter fermentans]
MIRGILTLLTAKGKRALASSVLWFSIYALSGIVMMLLVLKMLDLIMTEQEISLYADWLALVLLLLLRGISSTFGDLRKHYAGFDLNYELREKIIHRLKSFSLGFYTNERLGEISTVIHRDVDNMVMIVGHLCPRMLSDFIVSAVMITALLIVNGNMGLLMISILPVALLILRNL